MPVRNRRAQREDGGADGHSPQASGAKHANGSAAVPHEAQHASPHAPPRADGAKKRAQRPFHKHKRLWLLLGAFSCLMAGVVIQQANEVRTGIASAWPEQRSPRRLLAARRTAIAPRLPY